MNPAGPIVSFYRGETTDSAGRNLSQILAWVDYNLERYHDFIQWLFPLTERSNAVPNAPILQQAEIQEFNQEPLLQARLLDAFKRMLAFYSFDYSERDEKIKITKKTSWSETKPSWLHRGNHNFLRITRILKSLMILGLADQAGAFFETLKEVYKDYKNDIGYTTFQFWNQAVEQISK